MSKTARVYLDQLKADDSPILFKWINNRELVQLSAHFKPVSLEAHQAWFKNIGTKNDVSIFAIRLVDSDTLIGSCQLLNIDTTHKNAELQIRIGDENHQSKGLGKEALILLLEFGFIKLELERIYLHVFSSNDRAFKAYKKVGFSQEGLLRKSARINDHYEDVIVMSLLSDQFNRNSSQIELLILS